MKPSPSSSPPSTPLTPAARIGLALFGLGALAALLLSDWRLAVAGLILMILVAGLFAPRPTGPTLATDNRVVELEQRAEFVLREQDTITGHQAARYILGRLGGA